LTSDLGFTDASAMQFPNLGSMHRRSRRPTETLPVLPCMRQAGSGSLPEDFPFEFSENRQ
jgi:hypothetical protein